MENILIIGGTGKIGSPLVQQLEQKKIKAKLLLRNKDKSSQIVSPGMTTVIGDVTSVESIQSAMKGIEKIFLLISAGIEEAKIKSSIIDEAKKAGVKYMVMLSGAGANHNSAISQAHQHAKAEAQLKASGIAYTILQPYFFMQNFFNQLGGFSQAGNIKSEATLYGNFNEGKIAMVDTRDIAAVAVKCLTESGHEGKTYVISGAEAISYSQAAQKLSAILGKKINYINISSEQLVQGMTSMGTPEWLSKDLALLGEDFAAGRFEQITNVVEEIAGTNPITFDKFVNDNIKVFS